MICCNRTIPPSVERTVLRERNGRAVYTEVRAVCPLCGETVLVVPCRVGARPMRLLDVEGRRDLDDGTVQGILYVECGEDVYRILAGTRHPDGQIDGYPKPYCHRPLWERSSAWRRLHGRLPLGGRVVPAERLSAIARGELIF